MSKDKSLWPARVPRSTGMDIYKRQYGKNLPKHKEQWTDKFCINHVTENGMIEQTAQKR